MGLVLDHRPRLAANAGTKTVGYWGTFEYDHLPELGWAGSCALTLIRKLNEWRLLNDQYVGAYLSSQPLGAPLLSRCVAGGA